MIGNNKIIIISAGILFFVIVFAIIVGTFLRVKPHKNNDTSIVPTFAPGENSFTGRKFNSQTITSSGNEELLKQQTYSIDKAKLAALLPIDGENMAISAVSDSEVKVDVKADLAKSEQDFKAFIQQEKLTTSGSPTTISFVKKSSTVGSQQNNSGLPAGKGSNPNTGSSDSSITNNSNSSSGTNTNTSNTIRQGNNNISNQEQPAQPYILFDKPSDQNNGTTTSTDINSKDETGSSSNTANNTTQEYQGYESEDQKRIKDKFLTIFSSVVEKISQTSQSQSQTIVQNTQPTPISEKEEITPEITLPLEKEAPSPASQDNKVIEIVNGMIKACGNVITSGNVNCIEKMIPRLNTTAKNYVYSSTSAFKYYQCVGFVKTIMAQLGYPPVNETNPGAKDYAYNYPKNTYNFIKNGSECIRVGDIPIWSGGAYGHIAIVTQVYDCKTFELAEANYKANGYVGLRKTTTDYGSLAGWLRPKNR